jgi:hypothetical protein
MAKELPYFRFTPQEWQNGDITLESYELQGFFINVCAYYWVQNCSITKAMLEKKFKHDVSLINELEKANIFKHEKKSDLIIISFLNDQFDLLSTKRKRRQEAGSKGGKQKASNATILLLANDKQNPSYKDKDKDKDNSAGAREEKPQKETPQVLSDKERTRKFLVFFNESIQKHKGKLGQFKTLSKTDLNNLKKLREVYKDHADWITAFDAMIVSPWVIENNMATPAHYLRNENFQKYLNAGNQTKKFKAPWA